MAGIGDVQLAVNADMTKFEGQVVKGATKAGDQASAGFAKKFGAGLGKKDLFGALASGAGLGAGLGAVNALTSATSAAIGVVFDSIDAASAQREAMSLSTQVFENQTDTIQKWAAGAADAFGQSKTEALNFASGFGTAFKNVGFAIDETADKSMELTHLAADLGSAFDRSSEEAAVALRSGLLGESEPLRAFGVFLSEAAVDAELMAKGQKKVNGQWTNGQKVLARYSIIMRQTADSQGMFGRDTGSLADAQKALSAEVDNLQAELGNTLLPVMRDLANFAKDDLIPALKDAGTAWGDFDTQVKSFSFTGRKATDEATPLGKALAFLGDQLGTLADDSADVLTFWDGWTLKSHEAGQATGDASQDLTRFAGAANRLVPPLDNVSGALVDVTDNAVKAKIKIRDLSQEMLNDAKDLISNYYDPIEQRERIQEARSTITANTRILNSKTATDAEKRDAHSAIVQAQRDFDEASLAYVASGRVSKKELAAIIADLKKRLKTATGATRTYINGVIAALEKLDGMTATINISAQTGFTLPKPPTHVTPKAVGSAVGGPIPAHKPRLVGELGPELFVPDAYGHVVTAKETEKILAGGSGGTTNYNVSLLDRMPVENVRDLGAGLKMLGDQGYFKRRRW